MSVIDSDTHIVEGPAIWNHIRAQDEAFRRPFDACYAADGHRRY